MLLVLLRGALLLVLLRGALLLVLLRGALLLVLLRRRLLVLLLVLPLVGLCARLSVLRGLLLAMRLYLLAVLTLLVGAEHAHDLLAQGTCGRGIPRAALRMRLRVLVDQRLDSLLLVAGQVKASQTLHPAVRNLCLAGSRAGLALLGAGRRRLGLLGRSCDRCGERGRESGDRKRVPLHAHDLTLRRPAAPEVPIRTWQAA